MGIRVNKETLTQQLKIQTKWIKPNQTYHQMILNNELPYHRWWYRSIKNMYDSIRKISYR